jgi:hypothetical protein
MTKPPTDQDIIDAALAAQRGKQSGVTTTVAANGFGALVNLTNLDNWRAVLHQVAPVVVTAMVALNVAGGDSHRIGVYVALFFAIADPLLSFTNTTDTVRRILYGIFTLLQTSGAVAILFAGQETTVPLVSAGVSILAAFIARFYTPTSTIMPPGLAPPAG